MSTASRSDAVRERAGAAGARAGDMTAGFARGHAGASAGAYASRVFEMLAAALLAAGMVLAVLAAPWPVHVVAAGVFAAVLVTVLLASARPSRMAYGVIAGLAVLALVALVAVGGSSLRVAGAGLVNTFIDAWNVQTDGYVLHFAVRGVPEAAALMFAVFVGVVAGLAAHVMCACRFALAAGATSALLVVAGLFLQTLSAPAFACLVLGGLVLVSCCSRRVGTPPRATFSFVVTTAVVMGAALLVCAGYQGSEGLHVAKADAVAAFDEMRFGSDTLPQGDLAAAHAMNVAPDEQSAGCLEVSFADADAVRRSEPLYLRGFAGATYTGTAFERLQPADYEGDWTGLFNWLDARGFDALSQYAAYRALDDEEEGGAADAVDVTVRTLGAYQKYAYAPVSATAAGGVGSLLDLYRTTDRLGGNESATFEVVPDAQMAEVTTPGGWVYEEAAALDADAGAATPAEDDLSAREQDFLRSELAYRSFAYERYLEVPDEAAPAVEEFFFSDDTWDDEDGTLYAAATRIRTMLDVSCDYNAQGVRFAPAGAQPADYVTWFLEDAREGNAAAFASAAVLAFRQEGIPARYVEGYLLDEDTLARMGEANETSCTLDEGDAHAWVEVYVDGAGWLPVEVTPGFYDRVYGSGETVEIAREVAGGGDDDANTGSTGEGAPDWTELLPEELRPFAWVGLVLLCMIELLCVAGALELQRLVRLRLRSTRLRGACERGAASALLFERLQRLAADAGVELGVKPRESVDALAQARPEVHPSEFLRVIALMERERYGQVPLQEFEVRIVESLLEKLEAGNWQRASLPRRLVYRYAALYLIPLARFRSPRA